MPKRNHYQLLGVESNASSDKIRGAYRKALKRYHPDANRGEREGEEMLQRAIAAGRVLCDSKLRAAYDQQLGSAVPSRKPRQTSVAQSVLLRSQKLLLKWREFVHQGGAVWQRFFTAEWARVTEARAAQQSKAEPADFNLYLYQAIRKNNGQKKYKLENDGIYRRRGKAQHKGWQKKTTL